MGLTRKLEPADLVMLFVTRMRDSSLLSGKEEDR